MEDVTRLSDLYYHEISKALFHYLHQQQKLLYENKNTARELLLLDASEKNVKEVLERVSVSTKGNVKRFVSY